MHIWEIDLFMNETFQLQSACHAVRQLLECVISVHVKVANFCYS